VAGTPRRQGVIEGTLPKVGGDRVPGTGVVTRRHQGEPMSSTSPLPSRMRRNGAGRGERPIEGAVRTAVPGWPRGHGQRAVEVNQPQDVGLADSSVNGGRPRSGGWISGNERDGGVIDADLLVQGQRGRKS